MRTTGRRSGIVTLWAGLALLLGGCAGDGLAGREIDGVCLAGLQLDRTLYLLAEGEVAAADVGREVGEVLRRVGCYDTDDTIEDDGDSNFLAAGTVSHRVEGRDTDEMLTALSEGRWVRLVAEEAGA